MSAWQSTPYPGVRFREHSTRLLRRRPDCYFAIRYKVDGKLREEGLGWASEGWTPEKAAQVRADIRKNQARGEGPQTLREKRARLAGERAAAEARAREIEAGDMTFAELADRWEESTEAERRSAGSDHSRLKHHVRPLLGGRRISEIDVITLRRLHTELLGRKAAQGERILSEETVHHCLRLVRRIVYWARQTPVAEGSQALLWSGPNPFVNFPIPKPSSTRLRVLTYQEAETLLKAALIYGREKSRLGDDLLAHDLVLSGLHSGARISERVRLGKSNFLWDQGAVAVLDTKTGLDRLVPLDEEFAAMARRRFEKGAQWLFSGLDGGPLRPDSASVMVERIATLAGFNEGVTDRRLRVTDHTCRHTYATWLLMEGEDIYSVAEILGHESLDTTRRYLKFAKQLQRRAAGRIAGKVPSQADAPPDMPLDAPKVELDLETPDADPPRTAKGKVVSITAARSHRSP